MSLQKSFLLMTLLALLSSSLMFAQAQRPDAEGYSLRGQYPVGVRQFSIEDPDRPLDVVVWYPASNPEDLEQKANYQVGIYSIEGQALQDADPFLDDGPYPLIVFSHGSGGTRYQSLYYTEHLASYGFVVMAMDHPGNTILDMLGGDEAQLEQNIVANFALRPLDMLRTIAYADTLTAEGPLAGLIDTESLGVTGHSFGGYTALSVAGGQVDFRRNENCAPDDERTFCNLEALRADLAALRGLDSVPEGQFPPTADPRVDAVLLLAPATGPLFTAESLGQISTPTMFLVGTNDLSTPHEPNVITTAENLNAQPEIIGLFQSGGHYIFLESCPQIAISLGLYDSCSDDVWDMERAHDLTNYLATAFFLSQLKGDAAAAEALNNINFPGLDYRNQ
jgi:predicted dienelactone hydrolase